MLIESFPYTKDFFAKSLEDCIMTGDPECQFESPNNDILMREMQLTFFCGNALLCRKVSWIEADISYGMIVCQSAAAAWAMDLNHREKSK